MIQLQKTNRATDLKIKSQCENGWDRLQKRTDLGFLRLTERADNWTQSEVRAKEILKSASQVVFVGIGGSSLGGKAIRTALRSSGQAHRILFLENVDSDSLNELLKTYPNWETLHFVFISKSGSTIETLALINEIHHAFKQKGLKITRQSTVISELKSSPLTDWATTHDVPQLPVDLDVGGRFSVLSPVGLVPAAVMGLPLERLRQGAEWALKQKDLVSELAAQTLMSFDRAEWISQFWFYSDALATFGDWVQQLWAESLAKPTTRRGRPAPRVSSPMRCVGAVDQHSVLQQLMEGARDKHVWLMRVKSLETGAHVTDNMFPGFPVLEKTNLAKVLEAEATAMYQALEMQDISVLQLEWQDLSPETLGAGFMVFELLIGTLGEALDIDAFNQPGVELGKKLAQQILTRT